MTGDIGRPDATAALGDRGAGDAARTRSVSRYERCINPWTWPA